MVCLVGRGPFQAEGRTMEACLYHSGVVGLPVGRVTWLCSLGGTLGGLCGSLSELCPLTGCAVGPLTAATQGPWTLVMVPHAHRGGLKCMHACLEAPKMRLCYLSHCSCNSPPQLGHPPTSRTFTFLVFNVTFYSL